MIPEYEPYNGIAITRNLTELTEMLGEHREKLEVLFSKADT
jgi:hypothetical protein